MSLVIDEGPGGLFRGVFDASLDAVVITDSSGVIVLVNDRVGEVLGYEARQLVGESIAVLSLERQGGTDRSWFDEILLVPGRMPVRPGARTEVVHHDGFAVPVEVSMVRFQSDEGLLISVAMRDISERLWIEQENQRLRDEVIATVSHELRTPLTSILGYTELMSDLGEDDLSARARELLGVIERNAGRELQLVDDLLTMAFLDTDRLHLNPASVDLGEVARRVVEDQLPRAQDLGIRLVASDSGGGFVLGDFYRLVQAIENLVTNAVKFTGAGGLVEVRVRVEGELALLEVTDTGIGIAAEEQARLFERLYRGPSAIAAHMQGAGLGLSITQALVEAHDGRVELRSEAGVGTTVRVELPLVAPA